MYQVVACGLLSILALLATNHLSGASFAALAVVALLLFSNQNFYPHLVWVPMAGLVLFVLGLQLGHNTKNLANQSKFDVTVVIVGVLAGALINAFMGLLQYLGLAGQLWPWVPETLQRGVAFGVFRQTNLFATLLCCGIACAVYLAQNKKISVSMAWLIVAILHLGLAASGSRIGVVQSVAFALLGMLWHRQQPAIVTRLLVGQLAVLALAALLLPFLAQLHGFEPRSLAQRLAHMSQDSRLAVWADSVQLILAKPWMGWGWGEFAYGHYMLAPAQRFNPDSILDNAHNMPLQLAVELGLPAACLVCGYFAWIVWRAKPWLAGKQANQVYWLIIFSLTLHSMVEFPLWYASFMFLFALVLGAVSPPFRQHIESEALSQQPVFFRRIPWLARALALLMVVFCAVVWVQYQQVIRVYATPSKMVAQRAEAVADAQGAWLFKGQIEYAEFAQLSADNTAAAIMREKAERLLHFSAEPRVVQGLLYALWRLDEQAELIRHAHRYCVAFPLAYARWASANAQLPFIKMVRQTESSCRLPSEALKILNSNP